MKRAARQGRRSERAAESKVWYSGYNFDLAGVDEIGATPFWRAAYASDVEAMQLLVAHGADPNIPTIKPAGRPRTGDGDRANVRTSSGLPPVPIGGPGVPPLQAAAGVGYGEGFAGNSHRYAPAGTAAGGQVPGRGAGRRRQRRRSRRQHRAPPRRRARRRRDDSRTSSRRAPTSTAVNRAGQTTADMANGPVQRIAAVPRSARAAREAWAPKNNHKCVSC